VNGGNYLAALINDNWSHAKVSFAPSSTFSLDTDSIITAEVSESACSQASASLSPSLIITSDDSNKAETVYPVETFRNRLTFSHSFHKPGTYTLQFQSEGVPIGKSVTIRAGDTVDIIKHWLSVGGVVIVIADVVFVALMALFARRSERCFSLLFDPVWGKVAFYFNAILRHWPFLQLWLLGRYVRSARKRLVDTQPDPFEPFPLTNRAGDSLAPDGSVFTTNTADKKLWIQGNAGMGKSAVFHALRRIYFHSNDPKRHVSPRTLRKEWRGVYVFIPARRYETLSDDSAPENGWVVKAAHSELGMNGVRFPDLAPVQSMLNSGTLALFIDGINEVGKDEQVAAFALVFPHANVIVTSQTTAKEPFVEYALPADIRDYTTRLMCALLGQERGLALAAGLKSQRPDLWGALRSGYDVRLVIDLVQTAIAASAKAIASADAVSRPAHAPAPATGDADLTAIISALPHHRLGLYDAILAVLEPGTSRELEKMAWDMVLQGQRQLPLDTTSDSHLVKQLKQGHAHVVRQLSSTVYEFRHDQMRAYLAARWLVNQAKSEGTLAMHLSSDDVWKIDARDQAELWQFFASSLPDARIPGIWKFAVVAREREHLQHALQDEANLRRIQLFEVIGAEVS
jgi:hypothetical protein